MSLRYLLDTNVLSEVVKPNPQLNVLEKLAKLRGEIATSAITLDELRYGVDLLPTSKRKTELDEYVSGLSERLPILPFDETAARWHGSERARLRLIGRTAAFADGQIAAVAATRGLVLVTANISDFAGFQGLGIENWLS